MQENENSVTLTTIYQLKGFEGDIVSIHCEGNAFLPSECHNIFYTTRMARGKYLGLLVAMAFIHDYRLSNDAMLLTVVHVFRVLVAEKLEWNLTHTRLFMLRKTLKS